MGWASKEEIVFYSWMTVHMMSLFMETVLGCESLYVGQNWDPDMARQQQQFAKVRLHFSFVKLLFVKLMQSQSQFHSEKRIIFLFRFFMIHWQDEQGLSNLQTQVSTLNLTFAHVEVFLAKQRLVSYKNGSLYYQSEFIL